jgi:glutaredoxin
MKQDYLYYLIVVDDCPFCEKAAALLSESGVTYYIENATEKEEWLREQKEIHNWKTVPIVNRVQVQDDGSVDVEFVGGYTDLREHMNIGTEKNTTEETT